MKTDKNNGTASEQKGSDTALMMIGALVNSFYDGSATEKAVDFFMTAMSEGSTTSGEESTLPPIPEVTMTLSSAENPSTAYSEETGFSTVESSAASSAPTLSTTDLSPPERSAASTLSTHNPKPRMKHLCRSQKDHKSKNGTVRRQQRRNSIVKKPNPLLIEKVKVNQTDSSEAATKGTTYVKPYLQNRSPKRNEKQSIMGRNKDSSKALRQGRLLPLWRKNGQNVKKSSSSAAVPSAPSFAATKPDSRESSSARKYKTMVSEKGKKHEEMNATTDRSKSEMNFHQKNHHSRGEMDFHQKNHRSKGEMDSHPKNHRTRGKLDSHSKNHRSRGEVDSHQNSDEDDTNSNTSSQEDDILSDSYDTTEASSRQSADTNSRLSTEVSSGPSTDASSRPSICQKSTTVMANGYRSKRYEATSSYTTRDDEMSDIEEEDQSSSFSEAGEVTPILPLKIEYTETPKADTQKRGIQNVPDHIRSPKRVSARTEEATRVEVRALPDGHGTKETEEEIQKELVRTKDSDVENKKISPKITNDPSLSCSKNAVDKKEVMDVTDEKPRASSTRNESRRKFSLKPKWLFRKTKVTSKAIEVQPDKGGQQDEKETRSEEVRKPSENLGFNSLEVTEVVQVPGEAKQKARLEEFEIPRNDLNRKALSVTEVSNTTSNASLQASTSPKNRDDVLLECTHQPHNQATDKNQTRIEKASGIVPEVTPTGGTTCVSPGSVSETIEIGNDLIHEENDSIHPSNVKRNGENNNIDEKKLWSMGNNSSNSNLTDTDYKKENSITKKEMRESEGNCTRTAAFSEGHVYRGSPTVNEIGEEITFEEVKKSIGDNQVVTNSNTVLSGAQESKEVILTKGGSSRSNRSKHSCTRQDTTFEESKKSTGATKDESKVVSNDSSKLSIIEKMRMKLLDKGCKEKRRNDDTKPKPCKNDDKSNPEVVLPPDDEDSPKVVLPNDRSNSRRSFETEMGQEITFEESKSRIEVFGDSFNLKNNLTTEVPKTDNAEANAAVTRALSNCSSRSRKEMGQEITFEEATRSIEVNRNGLNLNKADSKLTEGSTTKTKQNDQSSGSSTRTTTNETGDKKIYEELPMSVEVNEVVSEVMSEVVSNFNVLFGSIGTALMNLYAEEGEETISAPRENSSCSSMNKKESKEEKFREEAKKSAGFSEVESKDAEAESSSVNPGSKALSNHHHNQQQKLTKNTTNNVAEDMGEEVTITAGKKNTEKDQALKERESRIAEKQHELIQSSAEDDLKLKNEKLSGLVDQLSEWKAALQAENERLLKAKEELESQHKAQNKMLQSELVDSENKVKYLEQKLEKLQEKSSDVNTMLFEMDEICGAGLGGVAVTNRSIQKESIDVSTFRSGQFDFETAMDIIEIPTQMLIDCVSTDSEIKSDISESMAGDLKSVTTKRTNARSEISKWTARSGTSRRTAKSEIHNRAVVEANSDTKLVHKEPSMVAPLSNEPGCQVDKTLIDGTIPTRDRSYKSIKRDKSEETTFEEEMAILAEIIVSLQARSDSIAQSLSVIDKVQEEEKHLPKNSREGSENTDEIAKSKVLNGGANDQTVKPAKKFEGSHTKKSSADQSNTVEVSGERVAEPERRLQTVAVQKEMEDIAIAETMESKEKTKQALIQPIATWGRSSESLKEDISESEARQLTNKTSSGLVRPTSIAITEAVPGGAQESIETFNEIIAEDSKNWEVDMSEKQKQSLGEKPTGSLASSRSIKISGAMQAGQHGGLGETEDSMKHTVPTMDHSSKKLAEKSENRNQAVADEPATSLFNVLSLKITEVSPTGRQEGFSETIDDEAKNTMPTRGRNSNKLGETEDQTQSMTDRPANNLLSSFKITEATTAEIQDKFAETLGSFEVEDVRDEKAEKTHERSLSGNNNDPPRSNEARIERRQRKGWFQKRKSKNSLGKSKYPSKSKQSVIIPDSKQTENTTTPLDRTFQVADPPGRLARHLQMRADEMTLATREC